MSGAEPFLLPYGDQGDGSYRNPVLHADFSDPDVIAVGEDYYLTASSFNCTPGLPVLHSRDLVNWRLLGYAMESFPDPAYALPQFGKGVWAPALRYHDGRFWIFFGAPDEGIFMTTAERAEGPWSPLHCLAEGRGLIDPCPFWDDDGRAYLVRAQAASRCGGVNSLLTLHGMAPDGSRLLDEGRVIIDGHFHHPVVEGPKVYKRNGFYYIFAPAGGVVGGWQTVFRARSIEGPYEDRIVLYQGATPINGPHQGGWVETAFGEHWFVHFQDRGAYGRVVHLQPMRWADDDWPRIGDPTLPGEEREPVLHHTKPRAAAPTAPLRLPASDRFDGDALGLQWQWLANARPEWWQLEQPGLRLFHQGTPQGTLNWSEAGHMLTQKPLDPRFTATTELTLESAAPGDQAGLILAGGVGGAIFLEQTADGFVLVQAIQATRAAPLPARVATVAWSHPTVVLALTMRDGEGRFSFGADAAFLRPLGEPFRPRDAGWMGARVGLYALNAGSAPSGGSARYSFFDYAPLP